MMYRVTKGFFDLQDADHWYSLGDEYPRAGYSPTDERIRGLMSTKNGQRAPLIELVEEERILEPEVIEEPVVEPVEEVTAEPVAEPAEEPVEKPKKKGKKK